MRNLKKLTIPPILKENGRQWLVEYLRDQHSDHKKTKYRHKEIRAVLDTETAFKCVYCESKIRHNTPGDVEHKVPSTKKKCLHFRWTNLTIACAECNRRKNSYYDEACAILDPYVDDVEKLLVHAGPLVFGTPESGRAFATVRILQLDGSRTALIDRKRDKLETALKLLQLLAVQSPPIVEALRREELARMQDIDAEYSAMVRTLVRQIENR